MYNRYMKIDINELADLKEDLYDLKDDEVLEIYEDGERSFVILNAKFFKQIEDLSIMIAESNAMRENMQPIENLELTYEEFENVKEQVIDALEKTFMPKPEKLN